MAFKKGESKAVAHQRHIRFVWQFCSKNSKTRGNPVKSYQEAGFPVAVSNAQCASRLLNSGKVKKMIAEYDPPKGTLEAKREDISRDYALARLQNTYDKAETAKDITNMVACVRLMMQHTGCLDQTLVVDIQDSRKLEEGHREASRKIANAIVSGDMLPEFNPDHAGTHRLVDGFNAVSAQFEEPPPAAEEAIIPDEISPDDFLSDD